MFTVMQVQLKCGVHVYQRVLSKTTQLVFFKKHFFIIIKVSKSEFKQTG